MAQQGQHTSDLQPFLERRVTEAPEDWKYNAAVDHYNKVGPTWSLKHRQEYITKLQAMFDGGLTSSIYDNVLYVQWNEYEWDRTTMTLFWVLYANLRGFTKWRAAYMGSHGLSSGKNMTRICYGCKRRTKDGRVCVRGFFVQPKDEQTPGPGSFDTTMTNPLEQTGFQQSGGSVTQKDTGKRQRDQHSPSSSRYPPQSPSTFRMRPEPMAQKTPSSATAPPAFNNPFATTTAQSQPAKRPRIHPPAQVERSDITGPEPDTQPQTRAPQQHSAYIPITIDDADLELTNSTRPEAQQLLSDLEPIALSNMDPNTKNYLKLLRTKGFLGHHVENMQAAGKPVSSALTARLAQCGDKIAEHKARAQTGASKTPANPLVGLRADLAEACKAGIHDLEQKLITITQRYLDSPATSRDETTDMREGAQSQQPDIADMKKAIESLQARGEETLQQLGRIRNEYAQLQRVHGRLKQDYFETRTNIERLSHEQKTLREMLEAFKGDRED